MLNLFGPPNVFIYLMLDFLKKDELCKCSRVNVKTIHACQHFKDNFRKSPLHTVDTYFWGDRCTQTDRQRGIVTLRLNRPLSEHICVIVSGETYLCEGHGGQERTARALTSLLPMCPDYITLYYTAKPGVQSAGWALQWSVCDVQFEAISVHFVVCSVQCGVCIVQSLCADLGVQCLVCCQSNNILTIKTLKAPHLHNPIWVGLFVKIELLKGQTKSCIRKTAGGGIVFVVVVFVVVVFIVLVFVMGIVIFKRPVDQKA